MAGQKRIRPNDSGPRNDGGSSATVYRKSAKKQRSDQQQQDSPKPAKKPVAQRTRPKDQPKPKTKHEFIQAKKAAALKEKQEADAARRAEEAAEKRIRTKHAKQPKGKSASNGAPSQPASILIKPPRATSTFKIVAGSYERLLYGLEATVEPAANADASSSTSAAAAFGISLKPVFTFPAHISSIRTVATAGADSKWLATGGTDEVVKVWDLRKQREVGQLTGHEGTITSLVFASRTYLLTTSADSHINLYRTRDWALLRTLKGHIGRINSASPHPTGRLALSVGSDRTIRMWDLMRGQSAASTRIGIEADLVRWDTLGSRFVVLAYRQAMIFRTDMTKMAELEEKRRIGDVCFFRIQDSEGKERELFFAGLEDGVVKVFDLDAQVDAADATKPTKSKAPKETDGSDEEVDDDEEDSDDEEDEEELSPLVEVGRLVGHKNRVRSVTVLPVTVPSASDKGKGKASEKARSYVAVTISSDGFIRTFDLSAIVNRLSSGARSLASYAADVVSVESVAQFDTKGTRLTCLTAVGVAGGASTTVEDEDDEDGADLLGSDDEEAPEEVESEEEDVDEDAENEELKALERALKDAQAKGLDLEELEELLNGDSEEDEDADEGSDDEAEDEDEDEDEDEGELE